MKNLSEYVNEGLVNESFKGPIPLFASGFSDLIDFGASFNTNDKDEAWDVWSEDYTIDYETSAGKRFIKDLCQACKIIKSKADYGTRDLGSYPWDDHYAECELLRDELDAKPGDEINLVCGDGDDGRFFYIYSSDNKTVQKAIDTFISSTKGMGDWDWNQCTIDTPEF